METKSFFWGMTIQPDKRYAQVVAEPFHVSKACLEPSSVKKGGDGGGKPVTAVYLESDNDEFLICSLTSSNLNENLDLNFNRGEKIIIRTEGGGIIHLTGYLMESPEYDFDDMDGEESDLEEEESETEEVEAKKQKKGDKNDVTAAKKVTPLDKLLADMKKVEGKKAKKPEEVTAEIEKAQKMKKILGATANGNDSDDDDSDSSDIDDDDSSDDDMLDTTDMLDLEAEEDSDSSDDDDEGEEEEEEDSEDEEEEKPAKKAPETPKSKEQPKASPAKGADMSTKKEKKAKEAETPPKSAEKKVADKSAVNTPAVTESGKKKKNKDKEQQAEKTPVKKEEGKEAKNTPKSKENGKTKGAAATPGKTPKRTLKGGLIVEDIRVGSGPEVKPGKMVGMYYEGRLKSNNKQFDACKEGSKPFKFRLGRGEVIKGWDIGVEGMKVGGKRRIICPPALAYGSKGAPPTIPSNATLVFDVECKFTE